MPRRTALLALSLAANAVLGVFLWRLPLRAEDPPVESRPLRQISSHATSAGLSTTKIWHRLSNISDDAAFVARLRADGFPERVVRSLVEHRIGEKFAGEARSLMGVANQGPYWRKNRYGGLNLTPEAHAKLGALQRKIIEEKRVVLGPEGDKFLPGDYGYNDPHTYGDLSAAKVTALKAIEQDYNELAERIRDSTFGIRLPEDREKFAYLDEQERADIARLLTPDELEQYERRRSPAAYFARQSLQYLDPSEDEFLTLYHLRRDFDLRYGLHNLSPAQADLRRTAQPQLAAQIEAALGPERFAEYQLVTHGNYRETRTFVTQAGLPVETAKSLIGLQRDLAQRADQIRANKTLEVVQQSAALTALKREAVQKTTTILGPDQFASYEQYSVGSWLAELTRADPSP